MPAEHQNRNTQSSNVLGVEPAEVLTDPGLDCFETFQHALVVEDL